LYANEVMSAERFAIGGLAARHKAVKASAAPEQKVITPSQRIALCA
jgi:hypothetical protein